MSELDAFLLCRRPLLRRDGRRLSVVRALPGRRVLRRGRLPHRQILPHLVQPLAADPSNGQQIVHALECPVRFAHLHDFRSRRRPDPRHSLQLRQCRRIDVHRPQWGFLFRGCGCPRAREKNNSSGAQDENKAAEIRGLVHCRTTYHHGKNSSRNGFHLRNAGCYAPMRFPCASYTSTSPKSPACASICARSPTTTICIFAESKYARAAPSTSSEVKARTRSRYVSR